MMDLATNDTFVYGVFAMGQRDGVCAEKNCGADISTLTRLIEEGRL